MELFLSKRKVAYEIGGMFLLALSVLCALGLLSYDAADPSLNTIPFAGRPTANWIGVFGSYSADLLLQVFGFGGYFLIFLLLIFSLSLMLMKRPSHLWMKSVGLLLLLTCICTLFSIGLGAGVTYGGRFLEAGGLWGRTASSILVFLFKPTGAIILAVVGILLSAVLTFHLSIVKVTQLIARTARSFSQAQAARMAVRRERARRLAARRRNDRLIARWEKAGKTQQEIDELLAEERQRRERRVNAEEEPYEVEVAVDPAKADELTRFELGIEFEPPTAELDRPRLLKELGIQAERLAPEGEGEQSPEATPKPYVPEPHYDPPPVIAERDAPPAAEKETASDDHDWMAETELHIPTLDPDAIDTSFLDAREEGDDEEPVADVPALNEEDLKQSVEDAGETQPQREDSRPQGGAPGPAIHERSESDDLRETAQLPADKYEPTQRRIASRDFELPPLTLLEDLVQERAPIDRDALLEQSNMLKRKFADFGIEGRVVNVMPGPVITMYEFLPAPGIKISKIANLADDLAMALSAESVRIVAPIPGKNVVGIEVPNEQREVVPFKELLGHMTRKGLRGHLPLVMGKDITGVGVTADLVRMPHLLVAGTTGAGKSVFLNTLIASILFQATPRDVRLIMIDPKMLELSIYNAIPHLMVPVITEAKQAVTALAWATQEMDRRYALMAEAQVRHIQGYNRKVEEGTAPPVEEMNEDGEYVEQPAEPLPYLVIVIDEFADLMALAAKELELSIVRLAQKARAAGVHLVLATQRPSVNVITGLIKANLPSRVAFQVSSKIDSRTIIDGGGAERLLGMGDMLYVPPGTSKPQRIHGAYLSDDEVKRIADYWREQGEAEYEEEILADLERTPGMGMVGGDDEGEEYDELYDQAVQVVCESGKASISYVQRRLKIGYNRSARLIERMEHEGIVSPAEPGKTRVVLARNPQDENSVNL